MIILGLFTTLFAYASLGIAIFEMKIKPIKKMYLIAILTFLIIAATETQKEITIKMIKNENTTNKAIRGLEDR